MGDDDGFFRISWIYEGSFEYFEEFQGFFGILEGFLRMLRDFSGFHGYLKGFFGIYEEI